MRSSALAAAANKCGTAVESPRRPRASAATRRFAAESRASSSMSCEVASASRCRLTACKAACRTRSSAWSSNWRVKDRDSAVSIWTNAQVRAKDAVRASHEPEVAGDGCPAGEMAATAPLRPDSGKKFLHRFRTAASDEFAAGSLSHGRPAVG